MVEYLIGVICTIDILCNFTVVFLGFNLYGKIRDNKHAENTLKLLFIIALLGVIFLPSKETMELLFLNN